MNTLVKQDASTGDLTVVTPALTVANTARFTVRSLDVKHVTQSTLTDECPRSLHGRMQPVVESKYERTTGYIGRRFCDTAEFIPISSRWLLTEDSSTMTQSLDTQVRCNIVWSTNKSSVKLLPWYPAVGWEKHTIETRN